MEKNTKKISRGASLLIAVMSFSSFVAIASVVTRNQAHITPVSLADDSQEDDNQDENKDEDQKDESAKKAEEKSREGAKKQTERQREETKKQFERSNKISENDDDSNKVGDTDEDTEDAKDVNGQELDDDGDYDGDESEDTDTDGDRVGDTKGMYKDQNKTVLKLQENIAEAEKYILEKQAEGVDVTTALANLNLAKAKLAEVGTAFAASDFEMAKKLSKEIKKESLFSEKDLEFAKDASESVREVTKKFAKVEKKIAAFVALGGDATPFTTQLTSLRADFAVLQSSSLVTRDTVKTFEKKIEQLKNFVERSIFALGGTEENDDLYADHEKDANDLEDDLNDVADIEDGDENGVAKKVRAIAEEHRSSTAIIAKSLGDIKGQSGFARTVFGPDWNALDSLTAQTTAMNTRADALVSTSAQIADPEIKQILIDRAAALRSEVAKLQAYVTAEDSQFSILGKFLSLFR